MAIGSDVMGTASKINTTLLTLALFLLGVGVCGSTPEPLPTAEKVRVVKSERKLYLMRDGQPYKADCISLGRRPVGDKIQAGDKLTPEGEYIIDGRNLESGYHRALHISYPDSEDRREARDRGVDPGGMIMIHGLPNEAHGNPEGYVGMDWTDGCIAVTNAEIEALLRVVKDGTPIEILP